MTTRVTLSWFFVTTLLGCQGRTELALPPPPPCPTCSVCPPPAPPPLCPSRWCPIEAFPALPRVLVEDRDQVLDLTGGDNRFILPSNPADTVRTIQLPMVLDGEPWVNPISLVVPTLIAQPAGVRYRIVREGGVSGHEIALFGATDDFRPCVAAFFHLDVDAELWTLGMNSGQCAPSVGVIPGMDAGQ